MSLKPGNIVIGASKLGFNPVYFHPRTESAELGTLWSSDLALVIATRSTCEFSDVHGYSIIQQFVYVLSPRDMLLGWALENSLVRVL